MPKPHWTHPNGVGGCQHSECAEPATHQWQRQASPAEIEHEMNIQGPYGDVYRNPDGPWLVAVFACPSHILEQDSLLTRHNSDCTAPDPGCACTQATP